MTKSPQGLPIAFILATSANIQAVEPEIGDTLPEFQSTDEQGRVWKSADHAGEKLLVLYFYPGDFTGGCIRQAEAFREGLAKLEASGAEVIGISGDEPATHQLF